MDILEHLIGLWTDTAMFGVFAIAALAGLVRGFAGFGAALVFVPVASALIDPATAIIMLWVADGLPALPLVFGALKKCRWATVLPAIAGYGFGVPAGVWLLTTADPTALRWFMAILVMILLAILISGRRYAGEPSIAPSLAVGATSGFLGGATQLSGPPILVYWLGGPDKAWRIRANVILFFAIATVLSGIGLFVGGVMQEGRILRGIAIIPAYAGGIFIGARLFGLASEILFRRVAYVLIAIAAITSLPLLDAVLGR